MATRHSSASRGTLFILIAILVVVAIAAIWALGNPHAGSAARSSARYTNPAFVAQIERQFQAWRRDVTRFGLGLQTWARLNLRITNPALQRDWQSFQLGFDRLLAVLTRWWDELALWFRTQFMTPRTPVLPGSLKPQH